MEEEEEEEGLGEKRRGEEREREAEEEEVAPITTVREASTQVALSLSPLLFSSLLLSVSCLWGPRFCLDHELLSLLLISLHLTSPHHTTLDSGRGV